MSHRQNMTVRKKKRQEGICVSLKPYGLLILGPIKKDIAIPYLFIILPSMLKCYLLLESSYSYDPF
jgi:hypothetical protein